MRKSFIVFLVGVIGGTGWLFLQKFSVRGLQDLHVEPRPGAVAGADPMVPISVPVTAIEKPVPTKVRAKAPVAVLYVLVLRNKPLPVSLQGLLMELESPVTRQGTGGPLGTLVVQLAAFEALNRKLTVLELDKPLE